MFRNRYRNINRLRKSMINTVLDTLTRVQKWQKEQKVKQSEW